MASDGDEIIVAPGTYSESINTLGKAVYLRSSGGPEETVIDASSLSGFNSVIVITNGEGADTIIEGFTITGGIGTLISPVTFGGGIYIDGSSPTVLDCIIRDNFGDVGGGAHSGFGSPLFDGVIFRDNIGAGLDAIASNAEVINSSFINNSHLNGGGAIHHSTSNLKVENSNFRGNSGQGVVVAFLTNTNIAISNSTFCDNQAEPVIGNWSDLGGNTFAQICPGESGIGDLNGDGVVNVFDLLLLLEDWGPCLPRKGSCAADLTGDNQVNVFDLLILLENWG